MTTTTRTFTNKEIIDEARRELAMRQRCYPRWVADGTMLQSTADLQIALQQAIIAKLEILLPKVVTQEKLF